MIPPPMTTTFRAAESMMSLRLWGFRAALERLRQDIVDGCRAYEMLARTTIRLMICKIC